MQPSEPLELTLLGSMYVKKGIRKGETVIINQL